jgi:hypothetical protein
MQFSELKTEVESWLLDMPAGASAKLGGWVNEAIKDACKRYNFRFMEDSVTALTVEGTSRLVAKPARWKESRSLPYRLREDGSVIELDNITESDKRRTFAQTAPQGDSTAPVDSGAPRYVWEDATYLNVAPIPDALSDWNLLGGAYVMAVPYWRYPETLVADADTNWLTENAEYYVIFKAASLGFLWARNEDRAQFYKSEAEPQFQRIKNQDKLSKLPDRINLMTRNDVYAGVSRRSYRQ